MNLVVNGCSYMESYAVGQGHVDLARHLELDCLRTTLKHSYTAPPTLYVLGMTILSRLEIPICEPENNFEGRWVNPQNQEFRRRWQHDWTQADSNQFVETKLKSEVFSILDRIEDLMYRMLSTVADLKSRGHRVLMFQQADNLYQSYLDDPRLALFNQPEIVGKFGWRASAWQAEQGVRPKDYGPGAPYVPPDMTHAAIGHHQMLNEYLTNYIQERKLLA